MLDMALDAAFPDTSFLADKFALSRIQHPSWLTEPDRRSRQKKGFFDERGKIGDGQLKGTNGGHFVFSELIDLRHIQTGRRFLVSYQNTRSSELGKVSDIVLDGLAAYVTATTP